MLRPRYCSRRTPGQQARIIPLTGGSILLLSLLQRMLWPTLNCTPPLMATARASSCTSTAAALKQVQPRAIPTAFARLPLPYTDVCLARAGAVLQSRAARGCLQGGKAHWSFQAAKVLVLLPWLSGEKRHTAAGC
jgi:hypothetical protein